MFQRGFLIPLSLVLFFILTLFSTNSVLAECNGVEIFKWRDDYSGYDSIGTKDGIKSGESLCTVVQNKEGMDVTGIMKCNDNGPEYVSYSVENKDASSFEDDPRYLCRDSVDNSGLRKAEFIKGKDCEFNYPDQNYFNKEASFNLYGVSESSLQTVCKDSTTIGKCVISGKVVSYKSCGVLACKMNTVTEGTTKAEWHADCVNSGCTENGVTAANGKHACIPLTPNDVNTKYKLKKCMIDRFDDGVDCPGGCGMGTSGDNECNNTTEGDVTCKDENITSLTYSAGSMLCAGKSNQTIYTCGSDGKFSPGETCVSPKQCAAISNIISGVTKVECVDPANLPNGTKILTISVLNEWNFFCDNGNGIDTGLGCIPYSITGMIRKLLPVLFGISGGIAFLIMVYGFIMVSTSSGDEKKLQEARNIVTSAIVGLLVVIFALFLYRLIVVNILQLPM